MDLIAERESVLHKRIAVAERNVRDWERDIKASECVLERAEFRIALDLAMGYLADLQNSLVMLDRVRRERAALLGF
jgi:hypothetical protein